jgi:hypothetical protein
MFDSHVPCHNHTVLKMTSQGHGTAWTWACHMWSSINCPDTARGRPAFGYVRLRRGLSQRKWHCWRMAGVRCGMGMTMWISLYWNRKRLNYDINGILWKIKQRLCNISSEYVSSSPKYIKYISRGFFRVCVYIYTHSEINVIFGFILCGKIGFQLSLCSEVLNGLTPNLIQQAVMYIFFVTWILHVE